MGTRHLISVVIDGQTKIAQYGQWDGYPTGQGATIAEFLAHSDLDEFADRLRECRFIGDDEVKAQMRTAGFTSNLMTMEEGERFNRLFPGLSRDTCANILTLVANGTVTELIDNSTFAEDTLFCEYVYTLDMDAEAVTVSDGQNSLTFPFTEWTVDRMDGIENLLAA